MPKAQTVTEGLEVWIRDRCPRGRGIVTSVRGGNPICTKGKVYCRVSSYEILTDMYMFVLLIVTSSYEILVAIIQDKPVNNDIRKRKVY